MDVSTVVLHDYPFPISKCYERLVGTRNVAERYDLVRYLFEATLKYCACLSMAQYLRAGAPDAAINAGLRCLGRPSYGHWMSLWSQCVRRGEDLFSPVLFAKARGRDAMAGAHNAIRAYLDPERKARPEAVSPAVFAESMVAYRNRTTGHGAPQRRHIEAFTPVLEAGVVDFLLQLDVLASHTLVYLSEIRVERRSYVHSLTRLTGTAHVAVSPDHTTSQEQALLGLDRRLFVFGPSGPLVSLHPFVILASSDVYILHQGDLAKNIDYMCHHTGAVYTADHIHEDFEEELGRLLLDGASEERETYAAAVGASLADQEITAPEREYLGATATRLGIAPAVAAEVEASVRDVEPSAVLADLSALMDQREQLLRRFGSDVLHHIRSRPNPTEPMRLGELVRAFASSAGSARGVSAQELERLIADAQNHAFAPGLVRTPGGYCVMEDHIAFKLTHETQAKLDVARHAFGLIRSGMRVGMDGGSTTLPIAEQIVAGLEADLVWDVTVVTNSLPVAQRIAECVERRGWSDHDSPVRLLICGGVVRPVTKAIAEATEGATDVSSSLAALIERVGGLDLCFVGANGFTGRGGISMPTHFELPTKRLLLESARAPHIVADATKFGVSHPVRIAGWEDALCVITNRPVTPNPELDHILTMERRVAIVLA